MEYVFSLSIVIFFWHILIKTVKLCLLTNYYSSFLKCLRIRKFKINQHKGIWTEEQQSYKCQMSHSNFIVRLLPKKERIQITIRMYNTWQLPAKTTTITTKNIEKENLDKSISKNFNYIIYRFYLVYTMFSLAYFHEYFLSLFVFFINNPSNDKGVFLDYWRYFIEIYTNTLYLCKPFDVDASSTNEKENTNNFIYELK